MILVAAGGTMNDDQSYQSMGVAKDHISNGKSYQFIPDADTTDITTPARRKPLCRSKGITFVSGIILGAFLACARTLYEDGRLIMSVYRSSSAIHSRTRNPKLHTLNTLLHLHSHNRTIVSIGPRPYFLINEMDNSNPELKSTLQECALNIKTFRPSDFVLGHRGVSELIVLLVLLSLRSSTHNTLLSRQRCNFQSILIEVMMRQRAWERVW